MDFNLGTESCWTPIPAQNCFRLANFSDRPLFIDCRTNIEKAREHCPAKKAGAYAPALFALAIRLLA
jgi:hypothetical protein